MLVEVVERRRVSQCWELKLYPSQLRNLKIASVRLMFEMIVSNSGVDLGGFAGLGVLAGAEKYIVEISSYSIGTFCLTDDLAPHRMDNQDQSNMKQLTPGSNAEQLTEIRLSSIFPGSLFVHIQRQLTIPQGIVLL